METIALANLELNPTHIYITLKPRDDWEQTEPHVFVAFELGQTVDGVFQPLYKSTMTLKEADFLAFIAEFQDMAPRFSALITRIGRLQAVEAK